MGLMIIDATLSIYATVARIFTAFITAGQVESTFIVTCTLGTFTAHQRVTTIAIRTVTSGFVVIV